MKERIKYLDICRAFAIIFIVLGHTIVHSNDCEMIYKFLYSFHVVLFFIISGYLFRVKENENILKFVKSKFIRIMIPYFVWALLFLIPYMILGKFIAGDLGTASSFDLITQIKNILYGNGNGAALKQNSSLWFLPALFSMNIFYYFVLKLTTKYPKTEYVTLIFLMVLGYISSRYLSFMLPWGINTVLNIGIFFYIGYLLNKKEIFSQNKKEISTIFVLIIFIIGILACYINTETVSCIEYNYGNYFLAVISGLCISISVLFLSYKISNNIVLEYIGQNTMGILIFHKLIILIFQTKLGIISELLRDSNIVIELLVSLLVVTLSIVISLIATIIVRKVMPVVLGEEK